jgi:hypothetical protein
LLVLTSKFQLHTALRITHLMVKMVFSALWYIRTSTVRGHCHWRPGHSLPIIFSILGRVRRRGALNPIGKLTDRELFQSLASSYLQISKFTLAKSLTGKGGPKAPSAIHGPLRLLFYPIDKVNIIADCLENHLSVCDHRRQGRPRSKPC